MRYNLGVVIKHHLHLENFMISQMGYIFWAK